MVCDDLYNRTAHVGKGVGSISEVGAPIGWALLPTNDRMRMIDSGEDLRFIMVSEPQWRGLAFFTFPKVQASVCEQKNCTYRSG